MSSINTEVFKKLQDTLAFSSRAVGLKSETIRVIGPGVLTLGDSGVSIFWSSDQAQGAPGWVVRETYRVKSGAEEWKPVTQTVVIVPEAEYARVAKLSLLLIAERRLDSFIHKSVVS